MSVQAGRSFGASRFASRPVSSRDYCHAKCAARVYGRDMPDDPRFVSSDEFTELTKDLPSGTPFDLGARSPVRRVKVRDLFPPVETTASCIEIREQNEDGTPGKLIRTYTPFGVIDHA